MYPEEAWCIFCHVSKALVAILDPTEKLPSCYLGSPSAGGAPDLMEVASCDLQDREELVHYVWNYALHKD